MGRIERSGGQDATMARRHLHQMLRHINEYEEVKQKHHPDYHTAQAFYEARGLLRQNFLKYYRRYLNANREIAALIPHKTGRKFKDCLSYTPEVLEKITGLRTTGYNRYDIADLVKERHDITLSASAVYRLLRKLGLNKLNPQMTMEKQRIIKASSGELGHIDIHYVAKGTVSALGNTKLYLLGIIDAYSRVCWLEPMTSIKALDVAFTSLDMLMLFKNRYGIEFKEMLTDNGSEFSARKNPVHHPFEKMLSFLNIKHRYTQPCRPQTNGKIERFWRTLENELLDGETFDTLESFKHHIKGYCLYYNEHRKHQGIQLKTPAQMVK